MPWKIFIVISVIMIAEIKLKVMNKKNMMKNPGFKAGFEPRSFRSLPNPGCTFTEVDNIFNVKNLCVKN